MVQEIALAKSAKILCGDNCLEWLDFADALSLFSDVEKKTRGFSQVMKSKKEANYSP